MAVKSTGQSMSLGSLTGINSLRQIKPAFRSMLSLSLVVLLLVWNFTCRANDGSSDVPMFSSNERNKIKELVLETLLENPEILIEVGRVLQQKQEKQRQDAVRSAIKQNKHLLFKDKNSPVIGNPEGDVTIVEFFDYNCSFCKQATESLKKLLASDNDIRLVLRELPILNEASVFASKAALASVRQDKYEDFHWLLMDLSEITEKSIFDGARALGIDINQLKSDMNDPRIQQHIDMSRNLAGKLGISGTPSFLIEENLIPGLVSFAEFKTLIKLAREEIQ